MHTDQIEAVVAVIEQGTTTAAADALHITPRGLRQRIKALEAELGVTLVVRDGRTRTLTREGRQYWDHLIAIRDLARSAKHLRRASCA
jgi:DNA-binding transcriptional LysR family regulator